MRLPIPLLLLAAATTLAAQEPLPFLEVENGVDQGWAFSAGARLMDYSSYLGSDSRRVALMPIFMAEYDRRFYVGPSRVGVGYGAGVHLVREGGFTWDLGLGIGDSRPESRSPLLAGMGDRRADLFVGTGLHYRYQDYRAGFTVAHGMLDDSGNRATLTLGRTIPLVPRWSLNLGLNGTYADAKAMNYDFGITPAQATNRAALVAAGDASFTAAQIGPYTASAGMRDLGGLISLNYRPKPRWVWTLSINGGVLLGGVRNSPLVASNDYRGVGIGFAYRF